MRVLLDCDGVLADFHGGLGRAAAELGVDWQPRRGWDQFAGLSRSDRKALLGEVTQPGFCRSLEPLAGAAGLVGSLFAEGCEVFAVTAFWDDHATWCQERVWWLWHHMGIDVKHVVLTKAKHLVQGDVFVDDRVSHVRAWAAENDGVAALAVWAGADWMGAVDTDWPTALARPADVVELVNKTRRNAK